MDKTRIAVSVFDKHAKLYQDKFMDVSMYGHSLDFFCSQISNEKANLLDIACGPGNITRYILNQRPGFKILGIDLSPNMINLAKINNPDADFTLMDCRDIGTLNNKYDGILCGFCMPYLSKEETLTLIRNASNLLIKNGLLYLSTMEDNYTKSGFKKGSTGEELFMHYHEAEYLEESLKRNHFEILKTERLDTQSEDGVKNIDLIIIAERTLTLHSQ